MHLRKRGRSRELDFFKLMLQIIAVLRLSLARAPKVAIKPTPDPPVVFGHGILLELRPPNRCYTSDGFLLQFPFVLDVTCNRCFEVSQGTARPGLF